MALAKKSTLSRNTAGPNTTETTAPPPVDTTRARALPRTRSAAGSRPGNAVERIEQAALELAAGLGEAASAAAELTMAMDQISSGAEQAAGAAQQSLALVAALGAQFRDARERTEAAQRQSEVVQGAFLDISAQIDSSVAAIELTAQRQLATVEVVKALESAASQVGEVGAGVADISDQTSLLALNATIEAARAGQAGAAFAVVADAVRALAETSETSARDMQVLASGIAGEVGAIAESVRQSSARAGTEAQAGRAVIDDLTAARDGLIALKSGAREIMLAATEAELAVREAERGAEHVASAAQQQSAAAAQVRQAVEQQSHSLDQSHQTAEALGALIERLKAHGGNAETTLSAAEEIAAATEQLSATVQELSGSSAQILVALDQIARGAQNQASATMQAATAMTQIENAARLFQTHATAAQDKVSAIVATSDQSRSTVIRLIDGIRHSVSTIGTVQDLIAALVSTGRRIEKIADGLAMVAVQTNMLGVSGAVEATRAGGTGRGFAMVAGDIRKLSQQASGNAARAKDTVQTVHDHLASVRRDLDQIVGAAETEIARNRALTDRFGVVVADLQSVEAIDGAIAGGTVAMLRSAGEIRTGTEQIAQAASLASDAAREAASSARQQALASEELAAAIEEIASIAVILVGPDR
jgi:methyl-accepting chemotaxis protein